MADYTVFNGQNKLSDFATILSNGDPLKIYTVSEIIRLHPEGFF